MKSPPFLRRFFAKRARAQLPVVLDRKRIFILPTKSGLVFALLLLALLIGSINYTNNLGFLLTFLLAGMGFVSIFHTYGNLAGLEISGIWPEEAFAGDQVALTVQCRSLSRVYRALHLSLPGGSPDASPGFRMHLLPGSSQRVRILGPGMPRGIHPLPVVTIQTIYPMGLFRAWAHVAVHDDMAVFPRPADAVSLICREKSGDSSRDEGRGRQPGSDDFKELRGYVPGDPLQRIAWKASSRGTGLLTKEFVTGTRRHLGIRWEDVTGSDEERLSRLCAMVLAAEKRGVPYWLELGGYVSPVDKGPSHRHRCLMRLAAYEAHAGGEK
jgi:uncharacterized protein (DUF58 family)